MKKTLRYVWTVFEVFIIIYVVVMTAILLSKNKYGYTQFGKYTLSTIDSVDEGNIKGVKKGDLLIVNSSSKIKKGDIIYYYVVFNDYYLIQSDPVIGVETDNYNSIYTIDHDGSMTIASNRVLGKKNTIIYKLGGLLDILESRVGFLLLVLLPVFIIFVYQIYELFVVVKRENSNSDKKKKKQNND